MAEKWEKTCLWCGIEFEPKTRWLHAPAYPQERFHIGCLEAKRYKETRG